MLRNWWTYGVCACVVRLLLKWNTENVGSFVLPHQKVKLHGEEEMKTSQNTLTSMLSLDDSRWIYMSPTIVWCTQTKGKNSHWMICIIQMHTRIPENGTGKCQETDLFRLNCARIYCLLSVPIWTHFRCILHCSYAVCML